MLKGKGIFSLIIIAVFLGGLPNFVHSFNLENRVVEHTLKNGMKLLMLERHQSPTVAAYIRFNVGAVDEITGNTGIAHMLEHMLFKGTKIVGTRDYKREKPILDRIDKIALKLEEEKRRQHKKKGNEETVKKLKKELKEAQKEHKKFILSEEFSKIYSENGGVGYNAYTSVDGTTYVINLPSNKLELWAAIESDRMKNPVLREFYAERDVITEERRRNVDTQPEGMLYEQFVASAFTAHPYGRPIIGWMSDIKNLSKRAVEKFLTTYYSPNNAIVAIVGDINPKKVIKLVKKYFGSISSRKLPLPLMTKEPVQKGERRTYVVWDAEPSLMIGYHKPTLPHPDDDIFDVIDSILSRGRTSRLYTAIVKEKQLAASVGTFGAPGSRYPNLFCFSAAPRYPHTAEEVEEAIYKEIEKLKTEPVKERELQKVKNQIDADLIRSLKSNAGLAAKLTTFEALAGTWKYILQNRERIKKAAADDIMRVAKKYFTNENRTVAILVKNEN